MSGGEPPDNDPGQDEALEDEEARDPEGSSGAEEGLSPWSPEAYDPDGEGPTTSTEDP